MRERKEPRGRREEEEEELRKGGASNREEGEGGAKRVRKKQPRLSLPCEDTERTWPSVNQEGGSHDTPTMLAP